MSQCILWCCFIFLASPSATESEGLSADIAEESEDVGGKDGRKGTPIYIRGLATRWNLILSAFL